MTEHELIIQRLTQERDALRHKLDELEEKYEILLIELRGNAFDLSSIGFTPAEQTVLLAVHASAPNVVSKERVLTALYWDRIGDWPNQKIVDVIMCKIRKKLRKHLPQVEILSIWGRGFRMTSEAKAAITGVLQNAANRGTSEDRKGGGGDGGLPPDQRASGGGQDDDFGHDRRGAA